MAILGVGFEFFAAASHGFIPHIEDYFIKGVKDSLSQLASFRYPNTPPDMASLVHAYQRGFISPGLFYYWSQINGVVANWQGTVTADEQDEQFMKQVAASISYQPDVQQGGAREWSKSLGTIWDSVISAHQPHFAVIEALDLFRRDPKYKPILDESIKLEGLGPSKISPEAIAGGISGVTPDDIQKNLRNEAVYELAKDLPGPSDIVHFTLRHGFEPSVIFQNDEHLEFPTAAREWFAKVGLDYPISIKDPWDGKTYTEDPEGEPITLGSLHWWTHWIPISPSQAYSLHQRLREDNITRMQEEVPEATVFDLDDVRRWLRINDYPPGIRDNLTAISYNPLGRIDLRRMYNTGIFDEGQLVGRYQDLGYSQSDAFAQVAYTKKARDMAQMKVVTEATKSKLISAYKSGAISSDMAQVQLYRLTFLDPDLLRDFDGKPFALQVAEAGMNDAVAASLELADIELREQRFKRYLSFTKKQYMRGDLNDLDVQNKLAALMMQTTRIDELIQEWADERVGLRTEIAANRILAYAEKGLITLQDADTRLGNLHYNAQDRAVMLQGILQNMTNTALKALKANQAAMTKAQAAAAKQAASQAKAKAAQAARQKAQQLAVMEKSIRAGESAEMSALRDIDKLYRQAQTEQEKLNRALYALDTVANMSKWAKAGLIDADWVRSRMGILGRDPGDVDRLVAELGL